MFTPIKNPITLFLCHFFLCSSLKGHRILYAELADPKHFKRAILIEIFIPNIPK